MEDNAFAQQQATQSFELRPDEIPTPLSFREGGRRFRVTHIFRPPQYADWLEYEVKLNRSVEITGNHTRFDQERAEAAEAIWDRIALRVEGYLVDTGDARNGDAESLAAAVELPDAFPEAWREKVPLMHKMGAIQLLAQVFPTEGGEMEVYRFNPDQTEVQLIAGRAGREYGRLLHTLKRPTVRQQKEFSRVVSSALYVRGSRTEKSLLPSRLREMARFYDELVVSVDGYTVNGSKPAREGAVKWMDALHKQTAVSALFNFEDPDPDTNQTE